MKKSSCFAFVLLIFLVSGCDGNEKNKTKKSPVYSVLNHSSGFSVEYPSDWDTTNVMQGILFIAVENDSSIGSKKYRENIVIYRIPKSDFGLDSLFVIAKNELKFQYPNATVLSETKGINSKNKEFALLEIKFEKNGTILHSQTNYFEGKKWFYVLNTGYDVVDSLIHKPIVENTFQSMDFSN